MRRFLTTIMLIIPTGLAVGQTSWTNSAGGTWSNSGNWSAGVPNSGVNATISLAGTYQVTLDTIANVNNMTINSANVTFVNAGWDVNTTSTGLFSLQAGTVFKDFGTWHGNFVTSAVTTFNWNSGRFGDFAFGSANVTNNGVLNMGTTNDKGFLGNLINDGTWNFTGTGTLTSNNLVIANNGLMDLKVDSTALNNPGFGNPALNNAGTIRKSAGTGSSNLFCILNSTGTIEAQTGTLLISGGGGTVGGTLNALAGASVVLDQVAFTGNITGGGGGLVQLSNFSVASGGAAVNFPAGMLRWTNAGLSGPGFLTNNGEFSITSVNNNSSLATTIVNNAGATLKLIPATPIGIGGSGAIINSGTVDTSVNGAIFSSAVNAMTITNTGTFQKSAGTADSSFSLVHIVNNGGTIKVQAGTMTLINQTVSGPGSVFSFGNGSTLELTGGAAANTKLATFGFINRTGTQPLAIRLMNDGSLNLNGTTQYAWTVIDGNVASSITAADFIAVNGNFIPTNVSFNINASNDVVMTFTAVVPEPSLLLLAGAGIPIAIGRRKRARNSGNAARLR